MLERSKNAALALAAAISGVFASAPIAQAQVETPAPAKGQIIDDQMRQMESLRKQVSDLKAQAYKLPAVTAAFDQFKKDHGYSVVEGDPKKAESIVINVFNREGSSADGRALMEYLLKDSELKRESKATAAMTTNAQKFMREAYNCNMESTRIFVEEHALLAESMKAAGKIVTASTLHDETKLLAQAEPTTQRGQAAMQLVMRRTAIEVRSQCAGKLKNILTDATQWEDEVQDNIQAAQEEVTLICLMSKHLENYTKQTGQKANDNDLLLIGLQVCGDERKKADTISDPTEKKLQLAYVQLLDDATSRFQLRYNTTHSPVENILWKEMDSKTRNGK